MPPKLNRTVGTNKPVPSRPLCRALPCRQLAHSTIEHAVPAFDMDILISLLVVSMVARTQSEQLHNAIKRRSELGSYASEYSQELEPYMFAAIPLHPPLPVLHLLSPAPLSALKRDLRHASSKHRPIYARPPYASTDYTRTIYGSSDHSRPTYASSDYAIPSYTRPSFADYQRASYPTNYMKASYADSEYTHPAFAELAHDPTYTRVNSQLSSAEVDYSPQIFQSAMGHAAYAKPAYQTVVSHSPHPNSQETASSILYAKPTAQGGYSYHKEPTKKRKSPKPTPQPESESPVIIKVHKYRITRS